MRPQQDDTSALDHESFLDIVANIVGILIILIVIVSVRAKNAPLLSIAAPEPTVDLAAAQQEAMALHNETIDTASDTMRIRQLIDSRRAERNYAAQMVAKIKQELEDQKQTLDTESQHTLDLQRQLQDAQRELSETLQREAQAEAEAQSKTVVEIKSQPTPISQEVFGKEVHFQLQSGRIAYVPIEELFAIARLQAREKAWKLDNGGEVTEVVGPQDGFRMRYSLEKKRIPRERIEAAGGPGFYIQSKQWDMLPVDSQLGEPIELAMRGGSEFRRRLARYNPRETTITLWTYGDSFETFRQMKDELYRLGFSMAGRPLPEGANIGGSPNGTRSSAQ